MKTTLCHVPEKSGAIALMIRHAERDPIQNMADALTLMLTVKGKSDAFDLGRSLAPYGPYTIFHSPVPRCRETAECLSRGIAHCDVASRIAGPVIDLGGPYITGNWERIIATIETLGHSRFVRRWFDSDFPPDLIMPLPEAARIQSGILARQLRASAVSSIHVTHDWNIMILREYYFRLRHEDIGDPGYLDGVCAYLVDDALRLRYHERETSVSISDLPT